MEPGWPGRCATFPFPGRKRLTEIDVYEVLFLAAACGTEISARSGPSWIKRPVPARVFDSHGVAATNEESDWFIASSFSRKIHVVPAEADCERARRVRVVVASRPDALVAHITYYRSDLSPTRYGNELPTTVAASVARNTAPAPYDPPTPVRRWTIAGRQALYFDATAPPPGEWTVVGANPPELRIEHDNAFRMAALTVRGKTVVIVIHGPAPDFKHFLPTATRLVASLLFPAG